MEKLSSADQASIAALKAQEKAHPTPFEGLLSHLETHAQLLLRAFDATPGMTMDIPWLKGWILKSEGRERVRNARLCQATLDRHHLAQVCLPRKLLLLPPGSGDEEPGLAVVEKVAGTRPGRLTLPEVHALAVLSVECCNYDYHEENFLRMTDGRLFFIDTDKIGTTRTEGLVNLHQMALTAEAKDYLNALIKANWGRFQAEMEHYRIEENEDYLQLRFDAEGDPKRTKRRRATTEPPAASSTSSSSSHAGAVGDGSFTWPDAALSPGADKKRKVETAPPPSVQVKPKEESKEEAAVAPL
ncbi:hypothetical protein [Geothrix sp. 21YS21S-2]|uniref:hypothetical protein n=1 Tax=Geothrix sp. 21YS21S-2 TaxID=3068893 RepID=UPI0027BAFE8F|nr:hypothetical protein [Geothrix sp. 21YS21S-2]